MAQEGTSVEVKPDYQGAGFKFLREGSSYSDEKFLWDVVVTATWGDKSLNYYVYGETGNDDRILEREWTQALTHAAAARLKKGSLTAFDRNDLTIDIDEDCPDADAVTISLGATKIEKMEAECAYVQQAEKSFRRLVDRLYAFAQGPSEYGYQEAASNLFMLDRMLETAHLGTMYGWTNEKMSMIRRYIPSLATRKQRNHQNFKYEQEYVSSNLSCFSTPKAWTDRPPIFDEKVLQQGAAQ